jgi:hypothetical protein
MSIRDEILRRVEEGRLSLLQPMLDSDPVRRHMYVSEEVQCVLDGLDDTPACAKRAMVLHAELERFVRGDRIAISLIPYKAANANFGRLDKPEDEVWDFRAVQPPALRVFGRFAERDVFIALTCWPRSKPIPWLDRPPLGERSSKTFRDALSDCKAQWRKLFNTYPPHRGVEIRDYVSDNFVSI